MLTWKKFILFFSPPRRGYRKPPSNSTFANHTTQSKPKICQRVDYFSCTFYEILYFFSWSWRLHQFIKDLLDASMDWYLFILEIHVQNMDRLNVEFFLPVNDEIEEFFKNRGRAHIWLCISIKDKITLEERKNELH